MDTPAIRQGKELMTKARELAETIPLREDALGVAFPSFLSTLLVGLVLYAIMLGLLMVSDPRPKTLEMGQKPQGGHAPSHTFGSSAC